MRKKTNKQNAQGSYYKDEKPGEPSMGRGGIEQIGSACVRAGKNKLKQGRERSGKEK